MTSTSSSETRTSEASPVVGYTTLKLLALPRDAAPTAVAGYYERELGPTWTVFEEVDGPVLNLRRGDALLSINLESWRVRVLEIAIDHRGYKHLVGGARPGEDPIKSIALTRDRQRSQDRFV